jgi:hypothetical protein
VKDDEKKALNDQSLLFIRGKKELSETGSKLFRQEAARDWMEAAELNVRANGYRLV